jgi:hypothetical protein
MSHVTMTPSASDACMDLLAGHAPLTLLIDLTTTVDSDEIYLREPGSTDWLPTPVN